MTQLDQINFQTSSQNYKFIYIIWFEALKNVFLENQLVLCVFEGKKK